MKKITLLFIVCFILHLIALAQNKSIKQFSFLLGNWEMKTAKGKITESWTKGKNELIGKSYRHDLKGDSVLSESVVIKMINKKLNYCVTGMEKFNAGITNFELISTSDKTVIFENKLHDFPQRVVYQNRGKENLLAWIEGEIGGKKRKSEFQYLRKK